MNKFEQLVDLIINEETEKANELFHDIVVEKSRDIYNQLIAEDESPDEEITEEEVSFDQSDDFEDDIESDEEGLDDVSMDDASDELEDEMGADVGGEDGADDEELEDRVVDLESALDELKAEFDRIVGGEEEDFGGDEMDFDTGDEFGGEEDEMGMDDMGDDEFADDDFGGVEDDMEEGYIREYTEKVPAPKHESNSSKSPVAGKNDMGGSTSNIVKGGTNGNPDGQRPPKGPAKKPTENNMGNRNVPGGKANKLEKAPAPKREG